MLCNILFLYLIIQSNLSNECSGVKIFTITVFALKCSGIEVESNRTCKYSSTALVLSTTIGYNL